MSLRRFTSLIPALLFTTSLSACFPGMAGQRQPAVKTDPRYSPDGSRILFLSTHDGDPEIYVMNRDGTSPKKLTDNTAVDAAASWSPDGRSIIFTSDRSGAFELYTMNADGTGQALLPTPIEGR